MCFLPLLSAQLLVQSGNSDLSANSPQNDAVCSKMKHINQNKCYNFRSTLSDKSYSFLKKEEIIVEGFPL